MSGHLSETFEYCLQSFAISSLQSMSFGGDSSDLYLECFSPFKNNPSIKAEFLFPTVLPVLIHCCDEPVVHLQSLLIVFIVFRTTKVLPFVSEKKHHFFYAFGKHFSFFGSHIHIR